MDYGIVVTVLKRALVAGTPLLLGTLGEIMAERSGILNLGVEGMMSIGAVSGFIAAFATGNPWIGLLAALLAGMVLSLIHAFVSVSLKGNQVVSGLALTMLGLGMSGVWGKPYIGRPLAARMQPLEIPFLSDLPVVGEIFFRHDAFFYLSILLGLILWFLLAKTRPGIEIRSVGENPRAAETQGVNVSFIRYVSTLLGGMLAGMAGAHLSLSYSGSWTEGITAGRGWIVVALTIFALWNPLKAFIGAFLFGGVFVLQYILQPLGISPSFLAMMPYVTTLGVLILSGFRADQRSLDAPATLGEPYTRGER